MNLGNSINAAPLTHVYYVAKNGSDTIGDGSILRPYLTVGAACTAIGSAADVTAFNVTTSRYYEINVSPGIYVEDVTIPNRPEIVVNIPAAVIQGNVTNSFPRALLGGTLNTAKIAFIGADMRGAHAGLVLPKNGIDGSITMDSPSGANNFTSLHLMNTGVTGGITFSGVNPGYQAFLFAQNTNILGTIATSGTGVNVNLYISNADTSGSAAIGACNGFINLTAVRNVFFNGAFVTNTNQAGRLTNVVFKSGQAHNFTGCTGTLTMDANSYDSYFTNVPTKGGETIVLMDTATGIKYTPATSGNWASVPTTAATALDNLATYKGGLSWSIVTANTALVKQSGYIANSASLITFTLPATLAVGDIIEITGYGSGGWQVAQNAGQAIHYGAVNTTTGATGYIASTGAKDHVKIQCVVANTDLVVIGSTGTLSLN